MATIQRTTKKSKEAEEIASLKARLAELEGQKIAVKDEYSDPSLEKINLDDYISVMSLIPWTLNLTTTDDGSGPNKKFIKMGEIKRILYKDLILIIDAHPSFITDGYCYILDPRVVRQHGLDEVYKKILTKDKMDLILEGNRDECVTLYESAGKSQQETIVEMLVEKLRDNPGSLDLNTLDKISRLSGVDIAKKAEEEKELLVKPA